MKSLCVIPMVPLLFASTFALGKVLAPADITAPARKVAADASFEAAERSLTIRLVDRATAQADAARHLLDEIPSSATALKTRLSLLRSSDDGKRLAATLDELSALEVERLISDPLFDATDIAAKDKELSALTDALKKLHDDPPAGFVPPNEQQDELSQMTASLRQVRSHIKERDRWLTSLLSSAPNNIDVTKSATLDQALAEFTKRNQQAWNAAQRLGIEAAKPEATAQITESARTATLERSLEQSHAMLEQARVDILKSKMDDEMNSRVAIEEKEREVADLDSRLASSEASRAVANAGAEATRDKGRTDAETIRLVEKCKDPAVQAELAPFLGVGHWQPFDGKDRAKTALHDPSPMSFSKIKRTGALNPDSTGLKYLYFIGNGASEYCNGWPHPDAERPKWGFPQRSTVLSQNDWQSIKHSQGLLNELGPTMVEQKMLAP